MPYTASDAVTLIRKYLKGIPLTDGSVDIILCDQTQSIIHRAYPWRWSLKALTPIALVDGNQDYAIADADFLRLATARISRTDLVPVQYRELDIKEYIPLDHQKGGFETIRQIGYAVGNKLRLAARAQVTAPATYQIQGEFQVVPTKIEDLMANLTTPDHYFDVFCEGLLWRAYKYADDDRAGSVQVVKGGSVIYTGQMGVFYSALQSMAAVEDTLGETTIFPEIPLGVGHSGAFSIYGIL